MKATTVLITLLALVVTLAVAIWIGLRITPRPFPAYPQTTPTLDTLALPEDLPLPVARYVETAMPGGIPQIQSAIITGRGTARFNGVTFPTRYRFTHRAGSDYRHYLESTLFGLPLLKVNEYYVGGNSRLELPFGVVENEPKIDSAANLGLWGESLILPAIYFTHPGVRWEPIDDASAELFVPFDDGEDSFTVTFDPDTGLITAMQTMRYREPGDTARTPWRIEPRGWQTQHGMQIPSVAAATWLDEGTPWLVIAIEEVVYNADIEDYLLASGL